MDVTTNQKLSSLDKLLSVGFFFDIFVPAAVVLDRL